MKVNINIKKGYVYSIIGVLIGILGFLVVNAYNSGGPASVVGHSAEEIEVNLGGSIGVESLQTAITNNHLGGNSNSVSSLWSQSGSNVYRSSGNVGIGTANPYFNLEVKNTGSGGHIVIRGDSNHLPGCLAFYGTSNTIGVGGICVDSSNPSSSDLMIYSGGDAISDMIIKRSGNVGIGMTNPTQKLDVNGNVRANDYYIEASGKWASTLGGYNKGGLYGYCRISYQGQYFCTATYPASCSGTHYNSNSCLCANGFTKITTGAWKSDEFHDYLGYYTKTYYSCIKN